MHLAQHQALLADARARGTLDQAIERIKAENPKAFHVEEGESETLSQRVFVHQPVRDIPMKGFVKHVDWAMAKAA